MASETKEWICGCPVQKATDGTFVVTHKNACSVNAEHTHVTTDDANFRQQPLRFELRDDSEHSEVTAGAAHMADKEGDPTTLDKTEPQKNTTLVEKPKRFYKVLELEVFSSDALSIGINVDPWQGNGAGVSVTLTLFAVCICLNLGFWFNEEPEETQQPNNDKPDEDTEEQHA